MRRITLLFLFAAALASFATLAEADDWWVVGASGTRPYRQLFLAAPVLAPAANPDTDNSSYQTVNVAQISEPESAPIYVAYTLQAKCTNHTMRVVSATLLDQDGTKREVPDQVSQVWSGVPDTWFKDVYRFACEEPLARKSDRQVLHLGIGAIEPTIDSVWDTFWADGIKPKGVKSYLARSIAELAGRDAPKSLSTADLGVAIKLAKSYAEEKFSVSDIQPVDAVGPVSELSTEWFVIYATGERPDRHLFLAREFHAAPGLEFYKAIPNDEHYRESITRMESNFRGAEVVEVMESAKGPDRTVTRYNFQCNTNLAQRINKATAWRNGPWDFKPGVAWSLVDSTSLARIRLFACDRSARVPEKQIASVGVFESDPYSSTALADLAWTVFWVDDADRIPYTSLKSPEELARDKQKLLQRLGDKISRTDSMTSSMRISADQAKKAIQDENEKQARYRVSLKRRAHTPSPVLETWIDVTEGQLIQGWGPPWGFEASATSRFLTYVRGYVNQTAIMQGGGGVVAQAGVAEESHECIIRFEVRDGTVYNYGVSGFRPQCYLERFPKGPNVANGLTQ